MTTKNPLSYLSLHETAVALNLPTAWLRREALAGRVPVLRAGRRMLFDLEALREALKERTEGAPEAGR